MWGLRKESAGNAGDMQGRGSPPPTGFSASIVSTGVGQENQRLRRMQTQLSGTGAHASPITTRWSHPCSRDRVRGAPLEKILEWGQKDGDSPWQGTELP